MHRGENRPKTKQYLPRLQRVSSARYLLRVDLLVVDRGMDRKNRSQDQLLVESGKTPVLILKGHTLILTVPFHISTCLPPGSNLHKPPTLHSLSVVERTNTTTEDLGREREACLRPRSAFTRSTPAAVCVKVRKSGKYEGQSAGRPLLPLRHAG